MCDPSGELVTDRATVPGRSANFTRSTKRPSMRLVRLRLYARNLGAREQESNTMHRHRGPFGDDSASQRPTDIHVGNQTAESRSLLRRPESQSRQRLAKFRSPSGWDVCEATRNRLSLVAQEVAPSPKSRESDAWEAES